MLDNDLVSAFSYINDQGSKEKIIVIEDVDTIFDDRKQVMIIMVLHFKVFLIV